ncbi:MAG: hypothetical protein IJU03_01765 [Thermoguttaceae bacterium]|nr:hypothetical protein [Thermoguttaceae bacterium]
MTNNPALFKLLRAHPYRIKVNGIWLMIIPDDLLNQDEVEMLRKEDNWRKEHDDPIIANFLPDDVRPKGIKKM